MTEDGKYLSDLKAEIERLRIRIKELERLSDDGDNEKEAARNAKWQTDLILRNSPDGVAVFRLNGEVLDANPAYCLMVGYALDELRHMRISELEAKEDPEETAGHIKAIKETGGQRFETKLRRKDGSVIDVAVSSNLCEFDGEQCLLGFQHDITGRKQAEEALRESEEKYRTLIEMFPHSIGIFQDGKAVFVNQAGVKAFGQTDISDILSHDSAGPIPENEKARLRDYLERRISGDATVPAFYQIELQRADGAMIPVEVYGNRITYHGRPASQVMAIDITERKRAEEALKESERRFHDLFEHFSAGYIIGRIVVDEAGKPIDYIYLEVNKAFEEMTGLGAQEVIGRRVTEVFPVVHETQLIEICGRVAQTGKPEWIEHASIVADRLLEVLVYSTNYGEFASVFTDITKRKIAENALREGEERYRAIWENSPVGICLTDRDGIYHYVNKTYCNIYGYSAEELIGRPFYELIMPSERRLANRENYAKKFGHGKTSKLSEAEVFIRKDGQSICIQYTSDYVMQNGQPIYEVSMNIDVTEKKRAEEALRESEEKYRLLVENAGEVIVNLDREGRFLLVNRAAAAYLGKSPADFIGKSLRNIFSTEIAEKYIASVNSVFETGETLCVERMAVIGDEQIWFRANLQPILNGDGEVLSVLIITSDITIQKRAEIRDQARLQLLQRLRQAHNVDECLKFGSQAIIEAELFKRAVVTLHNDEREIVNLGQVGLDEEIVTAARRGSAPDLNLTKKMMQESQRISHSFFIPAESGLLRKDWERYVPQPEDSKSGAGMWRPGDELFVPVVGDNNNYEGWLSVDTPFDGKRPTHEVVLYLEEVLDITSKQVHQIQSLECLRLKSQDLQNKNIALREVLASIEDEKLEIRQRIGNDVSQILIPALNKLIKKDGTINKTYHNILKAGLPDLVSTSGAMIHLYSKLSPREREICNMIKSGSKSKEIADALNISLATVQKHRELIRRKLGIVNKDINLINFLEAYGKA